MDYVDENRFATLFQNHPTMKLVVLNSCHGASISSTRSFSGLAPGLVVRGIPAVLAMKYAVDDQSAVLFAREFYRENRAITGSDAYNEEMGRLVRMEKLRRYGQQADSFHCPGRELFLNELCRGDTHQGKELVCTYFRRRFRGQLLYAQVPTAALRDPSHRSDYATILAMPSAELGNFVGGRLVLVGGEHDDVFSERRGLFKERRYGVEYHAEAVNTLLNGSSVQYPDTTPQVFLMVILGFIGSYIRGGLSRTVVVSCRAVRGMCAWIPCESTPDMPRLHRRL